ncbi:MAG: translocation/assembly module TamB domain-containing protein [Prevotella sp.]|nr:translocation/assembly module TamB domain-containing protein [Prevotella sp.]
MKKLRRVINWTIWSLLGLYLLLMVLIHLPAVQRWMGTIVANIAATQLGTKVSVGNVELGFLNRIIIDNVVIEDQQQKPMLRVGRLAAKVDLLPLLDGKVSISSAQLFGVNAMLYRDSTNAEPNYQFVIDALSSDNDNGPSALDLHIGSLIVRRLNLTYDQIDAPQTPGRLNMQHLNVADVSAHVLLRCLTPDSLNLNLKRITLREQSGIDIKRLSLRAEANRQRATIAGLQLQMPQSDIVFDTLKAAYSFDSIARTLAYQATLNPSTIALADLQPVLPTQVPATHTLSLSASMEGTTDSLGCKALSLATTDEQLLLDANGYLGRSGWRLAVERLFADEDLLAELHEHGIGIPEIATKVGSISLHGNAERTNTDDNTTAYANIATGIGSLSMNATLDGDTKLWHANVETDSIDLCRLTGNSNLGMAAARLELSGREQNISAKGLLPFVVVKGYSYHDVTIDALYNPQHIEGKLDISDPNLTANVEGYYSSVSATPHIRLTGNINNIAPKALNLTDYWGNSSFAAIIDADFTASSIADANGTIDLDDFVMADGDSIRFSLDNLHLRSGYDEDRHFLRMTSDFGEARLSGQFDLVTLPYSFAALLESAGLKTTGRHPADNDFTLNIRLTDSRWMQQLAGLPIQLNGPLNLDAQVVDRQRHIDIDASVPSFSYSDNSFSNATVNLHNIGDSATCHVVATRYTPKGKPQFFSLKASTDSAQLKSTIQLSSNEDKAAINFITTFYENDEGKKEVHVRVLPSDILMKGATWLLEPCVIIYNDKSLTVDHFSIHRNEEHLIIDGIASELATDSILVDFEGLDVAYILDLVNFHSVKFDGKATGKAYVCNAFSTPEAWADVRVDDFLFLDAPMGRLEAHALLNTDEGQIDLDAAIDDGADAQTYIDGFISPQRNELDLGIMARGTSLGFLHSFTQSFISQVNGQAWGDITVAGPLKSIDITGEAVVTGEASIIPLGTTYAFLNDTVILTPGNIALSKATFYDRTGNTALVNASIRHNKLKHFTYSMQAETQGLLAYDFPRPETGALVGGTVWANGTALIEGGPGEVTIDCNLTPTPGSVFYYNAANPDAISQHQFIIWGDENTASQQNNSTLGTAHNAAGAATTGGSDVRLNLRINTQPDATLYLIMDQNSDDHITLGGTGILRASFYNKGAFQLFGTYEVERGTYSMTIQNLLQKNFQFQPDSRIIFGGDPLQASLSLKAKHTVSGVSLSDLALGNSFSSNSIRVNCLMNILGTAGEPRVEFDLEMPTVNSEEEQMIRSIMASEQEINQQVVYLLGIGRFYTQGVNNASTQSYGQTELAMQSLLSGTVSSQINQLLTQIIKNDDWNFGANISTGNEGWHNAEYEGIVSGRMLNNRLLVNGQFGYRDNATQANPSFIGDFDIQYLLTPGGSVSLKAYNQTNDRYFTHSSLNTQGIGIILKKDFGRLSELFSHQRRKRSDK